MPKIKSIKDTINQISLGIILSSISIFLLAILAFSIFNYQHTKFIEKQDDQLVDNAISIVHSMISEKIGILVSSSSFIDYLRSGKTTRELLYPKFIIDMDSLKIPEIDGYILSSNSTYNKEKIYSKGKKTNYFITIPICYLDNTLDLKYGSCEYTIRLYFNVNNVIKSIEKINRQIYSCDGESCKKYNFFNKRNGFGRFPISEVSQNINLPLSIPNTNSGLYVVSLLILTVVIIMVTALVVTLIRRLITRDIIEPANNLVDQVKSNNIKNSDYLTTEVKYLAEQLIKRDKRINAIKDKEAQIYLAKIASQAAHDIRSPVSSINTIVNNINISDQKKKLLLEASSQVNDIANNLLNKYVEKESKEPRKYLLLEVVENALSVVNVNINPNIRIEYNVTDEARLVWVKFNNYEFKRVLINLINNSIEAIGDDISEGLITVEQEIKENKVLLTIKDNGCGTDKNLIDLARQNKLKTTKKNGHGIGLSGVVEFINNNSGEITIDSKLGVGTTVRIFLDKEISNYHLSDNINIGKCKKVYVIDDDISIYNSWKQVFPENFEIKYISNPEEAIDKIIPTPNNMYLVDYNFNEYNLNGIDVISNLKISNSSYLVTSEYNDQNIIEACKSKNIKIIPKISIPFLKANFENNKIIFLDDNETLVDVWEALALQKGITFRGYKCATLFLKEAKSFSHNDTIYIDLHLNKNVNGLDIAKTIYDNLGLTNIYIATGDSSVIDMKNIYWIKGIVGKSPIF